MNDPYAVIKTVVLSEKSNTLTEEQNKYTFKIDNTYFSKSVEIFSQFIFCNRDSCII